MLTTNYQSDTVHFIILNVNGLCLRLVFSFSGFGALSTTAAVCQFTLTLLQDLLLTIMSAAAETFQTLVRHVEQTQAWKGPREDVCLMIVGRLTVSPAR